MHTYGIVADFSGKKHLSLLLLKKGLTNLILEIVGITNEWIIATDGINSHERLQTGLSQSYTDGYTKGFQIGMWRQLRFIFYGYKTSLVKREDYHELTQKEKEIDDGFYQGWHHGTHKIKTIEETLENQE